ncbi:MAG: aminotransferase class I/II-fold pyridoxal phosphate-dependent enzyme [Lachnospiraceae bacterium]|nr:aminotransferase class I/II-fold pyridoxal phosphate-dependent enzyme [Lachnospiraceae bacterium]
MKSFIAQNIRDLPYSGIRKFFDIAAEMKDIISLSVGEPDFATPLSIREEAVRTLESQGTKYTSNVGLLELRNEISRYLSRKYDVNYDPNQQILITVGASEGIDVALRAILNPGDEVLVVEPCYVSYRPCVLMAGGVPVTIPTSAENNFRVKPEDIEMRITEKTKAILISYPSNPTGAIMERKDIEAVADLLRKHEILVISDEIYAELTYGDEAHVSIASLPGMYERTILLNGFSKAFAMTGWRLGYACGPEEIIAEMIKIHQYVIMCAPTNAQHAGICALRSCDEEVKEMKAEYDLRRRFMLDEFWKMGIDCFESRGAFYLFPSIKSFGLSSEEFCIRLLKEQRLAIVPGPAFGECGEGFVRICYAYSLENIREALSRIQAFINTLKKEG